MIKINMDAEQVKKVETMLAGIEGGSRKVLMRSINRVLSGVKTDLNKETRKYLNIKAARVSKDLKSYNASLSRLNAKVSSIGKPVGLTQFTGTKQNKKGVSVSVKKNTSRTTIQRAFIARGIGNNEHVFWRKWHGPLCTHQGEFHYTGLPRYMRLPIKTLYGPRIQDIQDKPLVMNNVEAGAVVRLRTRIDHELSYFLRQYNG